MLAKAAGKPADALADEVLVDWLNTHHGPVLAFIDTQDKARADFETSLIPATARFERINQEME
jgi:hypothetical protein